MAVNLTRFGENVNNIQALDDNPNISGLSSAELKARFDKAGADIKTYINGVLTEEVEYQLDLTNGSITTLGSNISSQIGNLGNLKTTSTNNLVNAINSLLDEIYYKNGDTYTTTKKITTSGFITSSGKNLYFSIPLPKRLNNVNQAIINTMKICIRGTSGYVNNANEYWNATGSGYSITYQLDQNMLNFILVKSTAYTNVSNNTPVAISIEEGLSITFNKV